MPYDGIVTAAACHEFNEKIIGARIEKIYQPLKDELILTVSKPRVRYRLLISANAKNARMHLTETAKPNPAAPPLFCMVLRKHLEGGRIAEITQTDLERIIHINIDTRDELGRPTLKKMIVEIMGKHSNIILVDAQTNQIIDGIKRYSHAVSRHREVLPGREYTAPPKQDKAHPLGLDEEQFFQLITAADLDLKLTDILLKTFSGFSPRMCMEIVYRSGLPLELKLNNCGEYDLRLLWQQFNNICADIEQGNFNPTLVLNTNASPKDFAAFSLTQFADLPAEHGEMSAVLDSFYTHHDRILQIQAKQQSLLTVVNREINRLKNKLPKYQQSLSQAEKADNYRIYGDLLTANMYRLQKGMKKIELENYYSAESEKVIVELDPQKTPAENAQAYFKKYVKAKKTVEAVKHQLIQAEQELDYLEGVESSIRYAESLTDLEEIHIELAAQGYAKPINDKKKKDKKRRDKPQPLCYQSSDGITILVGKNNRQNDYLTLRLAKPEDIWLHTKDIPGSHVVIKTESQTVPSTTLEEAAVLAAYHSKAQHSSKVPVDYTLIKHVHKPNGAKPGMVIYENQQTVIVDPDEALVQKLSKIK